MAKLNIAHLDGNDSESCTFGKSSMPRLLRHLSVVVMDECPRIRWR
jgi:hypothetical protein